jgi:nicotinate-nucleotide adenylyltransferase
MKRVGILGGTFDPIHNGHLKLAENAYAQFPLDEILFMPAPNPPHKTDHLITDFAVRMEMVRLAIRPYAGFVCSDFEAGRQGKSYTAQTLEELQQANPDTAYSFILGADSFYEIGTWYHPEIILRLADLIVADRDYEKNHQSLEKHADDLRERYGARIGFIRAEEVDISSVHLRKLISENRSTEKYLPAAVLNYIREHHLYHEQR